MEFLVRRRFWVVDLVGIGICGILTGHAAGTLIVAALPRDQMAAPARRGGPPPPAPASAADKSIDGIVGRNLFCSTCSDVSAPEPSRRPFTVLAIMFAPAPSDSRWSAAIIRDDEAATTGPYGVGARLRDATIEAIDDTRVVLDVGRGRREFLELLRRQPHALSAGRPPAPDVLGDGVRKTGARSYEIKRGVLDYFLAGGLTPPWPRVVPQARDGEPVGLRLFGVRDGPFSALGLSDGDLLLEVNGRSIATPDAALAAFAALRTASHVSLAILREGRRVRIDYVVR